MNHEECKGFIFEEEEEKKLDMTAFSCQERLNAIAKEMRLKHLEDQAMFALKVCCDMHHQNAVYPTAMNAGGAVTLHLLHRLGYHKANKCKIMVVDTFHLFDETHEFLRQLESHYSFKAQVFCAQGIALGDKDAFDKKYGPNLWKEDIEHYDKVCKVEPFQRGLRELQGDCMITGRTRWQGNNRAWIDMFEDAPGGEGPATCNPLAYWTLEDVFDYISKYRILHHPLHAKGFSSIGDAKDTKPNPEDGSTRFVNFQFEGEKSIWLEYAAQRKGRFAGSKNKDGTKKTECGIHVAGANRTYDRDLWENSKVKNLSSPEEVVKVKNDGRPAVIVVYAPWCKFCKAMEQEYSKLAESIKDLSVYKFRGDEMRDFVKTNLNTKSFPTVNGVRPDGTLVKYESELRTVDALKAFVKEEISQ